MYENSNVKNLIQNKSRGMKLGWHVDIKMELKK
jgi:hypothetical protein